MRTGLVIFDCDGVLVDSEPVANQVLAAMVTELGLPTTTEDSMRTFMGRTIESCIDMIEERLGERPPAGFAADLERRTFEAFERELRPVEGVAAAIDAVMADGLRTCVASSGSVAKMERTLGLTGLLGRFRGRLYSATDVERSKPHPDIFLHAASEMGFRPADCVVIEDSVLGVEGAVAAGMSVLGFARDTVPEALEGAGARVFAQMGELPALVRDIAAGQQVA